MTNVTSLATTTPRKALLTTVLAIVLTITFCRKKRGRAKTNVRRGKTNVKKKGALFNVCSTSSECNYIGRVSVRKTTSGLKCVCIRCGSLFKDYDTALDHASEEHTVPKPDLRNDFFRFDHEWHTGDVNRICITSKSLVPR